MSKSARTKRRQKNYRDLWEMSTQKIMSTLLNSLVILIDRIACTGRLGEGRTLRDEYTKLLRGRGADPSSAPACMSASPIVLMLWVGNLACRQRMLLKAHYQLNSLEFLPSWKQPVRVPRCHPCRMNHPRGRSPRCR